MHFFIQTKLIHQVRINITIIGSRVNQNRNNSITKITVYLDNRFLVIHLPVILCYIDTRNALPNIPNSLYFLCTVDLRHTILILQKISLKMILTTCQTLQLSLTITFILLFSSLRSIKILVRCNIISVGFNPVQKLPAYEFLNKESKKCESITHKTHMHRDFPLDPKTGTTSLIFHYVPFNVTIHIYTCRSIQYHGPKNHRVQYHVQKSCTKP